MKRFTLVQRAATCICLLSGMAVALATPLSARASDQPSVRQFVQIKWPRAGRLAPDGTFYFIHNPDGLFQLYARPSGAKDARKLTDFPDGISSYTVSEDGKWIALTAAIGGNEQSDIYLMETANGNLRALFAHPDVVFGSIVWRRDSRGFAFKANDASRSDFHVYLYDLDKNATRPILVQSGDTSPVDFSSDGSKLMCRRMFSSTHTEFFEVELASGKSRQITPETEAWAFDPIGYTADNKSFIAATDYRGDKSNVVSIDLATRKIEPLLPQWAEFEADYGVLNQERSMLAVCLNEDGYGGLHVVSLPDRKEMKLPNIPRGVVGNVSFQAGDMLYAVDNANTPGVIYKCAPGKPDASPVALTESDTQGIDLARYPLPELVRYKSFDGLEVPAFIYLPPGYSKGTRIPFIVSYHGGPEGQYRPNFNYLNAYFLSRGFGILAPNVRGSSGYGKKYLELDNYKNRMDSVKDGIEAARWLVKEGYSTPPQIAAYGGSYGGFMVMATITEAPDAFGAACNIVGICNMQTFLERTKDYRRKLREVEYGPLTDAEFLKSISPIYKVDRIQCPLMIAHGANDPRVPLHEAEQLHEKMKHLKKPVEMLVFPDEGHGFAKEQNRIVFAERVTEFFQKNLAKPGSKS